MFSSLTKSQQVNIWLWWVSLLSLSMINCSVTACSKQESNMTAFRHTVLCSVQCCWTYLYLAAVNKTNNSPDMKPACPKHRGCWFVHLWVYISNQTLSCTQQKLCPNSSSELLLLLSLKRNLLFAAEDNQFIFRSSDECLIWVWVVCLDLHLVHFLGCWGVSSAAFCIHPERQRDWPNLEPDYCLFSRWRPIPMMQHLQAGQRTQLFYVWLWNTLCL